MLPLLGSHHHHHHPREACVQNRWGYRSEHTVWARTSLASLAHTEALQWCLMVQLGTAGWWNNSGSRTHQTGPAHELLPQKTGMEVLRRGYRMAVLVEREVMVATVELEVWGSHSSSGTMAA